jgi:hypothetical protein
VRKQNTQLYGHPSISMLRRADPRKVFTDTNFFEASFNLDRSHGYTIVAAPDSSPECQLLRHVYLYGRNVFN